MRRTCLWVAVATSDLAALQVSCWEGPRETRTVWTTASEDGTGVSREGGRAAPFRKPWLRCSQTRTLRPGRTMPGARPAPCSPEPPPARKDSGTRHSGIHRSPRRHPVPAARVCRPCSHRPTGRIRRQRWLSARAWGRTSMPGPSLQRRRSSPDWRRFRPQGESVESSQSEDSERKLQLQAASAFGDAESDCSHPGITGSTPRTSRSRGSSSSGRAPLHVRRRCRSHR